MNIWLMWTVAVFALSFAAYPNLLDARASTHDGVSSASEPPTTSALVFKVDGMDCESCAAPIKAEVERLPGVQSARIEFSTKKLVITAGADRPHTGAILAAVKRAGFSASQ